MIDSKILSFFINFILLLGGTSGLILALFIYFRNKNRLIWTYILTLFYWSLNQFSDSFYFIVNEISNYRDEMLNSLLNDFSYLTIGLFLFFYTSLIFQLFKEDMLKILKVFVIIFSFIVMIPVYYINHKYGIGQVIFDLIQLLKLLVLYGLLYGISIYIFAKARQIDNKEIRRILRVIAVLQWIFYPIMIYEGVKYTVFPYGVSSFALFYFLFNIIWLAFVTRYLHFPELKIVEYTDALNNLFNIYKISPREQEIVKLLMEGLSYKQISSYLFISYETVKTHINNIYNKAGVKSKMELAALVNKCEK